MEKLSVLRQDYFRESPTLTLLFSEAVGDPKLFQILIERGQDADPLTQGVKGCARPQLKRGIILSAHSDPPLATDLSSEQAARLFGERSDLLFQPQRCSIQVGHYRAVAQELMRLMEAEQATERHHGKNREIYFPLKGTERLAAVVFDLSLLTE